MSETTSTPDATPTPAAPASAPEAPQTFSLEYVQELRRESAGYRSAKNEAVEAAKAAADSAWQEKLDAATATHTASQEELSKSQLTLLKLTKVLEAAVPSDQALTIAEHVIGTDEESVSASVKSLKAILGSKPAKDSAVDPSQGSGQGVIPLNGDKVLDALKAVVGAPRH